MGDGSLEESHGRIFAFIGVHLDEAGPRVIIDGHVGDLPACALHGITAIAGDAVAGPHDPPKLLGIHVQQLTRCRALVAHHRLDRIERLEAGQAAGRQDAADRRDAAANDPRDRAHRHATSAQPFDPTP